MSCVWTDEINCKEYCTSPYQVASIFLDEAWAGVTNQLSTTNLSLLQHINEMLYQYGVLSVVIWWYFYELSPDQIEETLDVSIDYGVAIDNANINRIAGGCSTIHNSRVQSWATFENNVPETPIADFICSIPLFGPGPNFSSSGAYMDVMLYAGGYTPFVIGNEPDPNIPAGLMPDTAFESAIFLIPLLDWSE